MSLFIVRHYARHSVYAVAVCVCVCLSHTSIVSKWLNRGSHKQFHTIAQGI